MIQYLEELSINAWPALHNMLYDGWLLRFSKGYTKRANSINPIYNSSTNIYEKINTCEEYYKSQNLEIVYKLTDAVYPSNLDLILENLNYRIDSKTSVQVLPLDNLKPVNLDNITINKELSEEWLISFIKLSKVSEKNINTLRNMLKLILPDRFFISLHQDEKIIACGLGVLQNKYIGIFDIIVDENYRNKGYGEKLVASLLSIGALDGAKNAYLQVMLNNPPALKLYSKLGFNEVYKYWYRVKQ